MTVTLAASDSDQGSGQRTLDLTGVAEGDLIIVIGVHRTSTQTTTLSGTGWTETLVETQISDSDNRRAINVAWKIADASPATSYTFQWSGSPTTVAVGMVFNDSLGGTWGSDGVDNADNGTTAGQSISAPTGDANANADGVAIGGIVLRSGEPVPATEVDPDAGYTTGPGNRSGTGEFDLLGVAAYEILTATGTQTTGFDWTDSAADAIGTVATEVWSLTPPVVTGVGAGVLGGLTGAGAGAVAVDGTGAGVLGPLTGAGVGAVAVDGTGTGTLGPLTGAGVGAVAVDGTGAGVLGPLTGTGIGVRGITGTGAGALGALTGAGVGAVAVDGTGAGVLGSLTGTGIGVRGVTGTGAGALGGLAGAGVGAVTVVGTGTGALGDLTGAGVGAVGKQPAIYQATVTSSGLTARISSEGQAATVSSGAVRARVS